MSSTAIFDYGKYTSVAQKAGLHYTRSIKKIIFFFEKKFRGSTLHKVESYTGIYSILNK